MNDLGPTSHSFISQRLRLHYVDWGNAEAPPLILQHGGRDHCRSWDWMAQRLRHDWHVIAPDLRGHGDSAWSPDGDYSSAAFVYDFSQLVQTLGYDKVTIIAHSLGGYITTQFVGLYPEKVVRFVNIEGLSNGPKELAHRASTTYAERLSAWIAARRASAGRLPRRYVSLAEAYQRMKEANSYLSDEQARQKLMARGLMVTTLANDAGSAKPAAVAAPKKAGFSFGAKVTGADVTIMTRQLATLIIAGLPLLRALELITKQERNPTFKAILANVAESVSQGNNLSEALQAHPKVFDKLFVNMVRAGEAGGVLDKVLDRLAKFREKAERIQKKVKSAMVYPGVVMSVAVIIVYILMVKVVPSFQKLLDGQKTTMPPLTQFVVGISKALTVYWWATPVILFGLYFGLKTWLATDKGKEIFDRILFKMPKVGGFVQIVSVSRFARTFGTLMASGVPILQSITITRDTLDNVVIANSLARVHDRVRDGEPLSVPLEQSGVFPQMVTSMIQVGEETGQLPEMLNRVADIYDEEVDNAVTALTSIIEPVLIVFLAVVVGTIVLAMFLPLIALITKMTGGG